MCDCQLSLHTPGGVCICPGDEVKLGRFETATWKVAYGWYSWGGNRPVCGWYLINLSCTPEIKPLQKPDLDDIYLINRQ